MALVDDIWITNGREKKGRSSFHSCSVIIEYSGLVHTRSITLTMGTVHVFFEGVNSVETLEGLSKGENVKVRR